MIAFFVPSAAMFELLGRLLVLPTREVDGAWRYWRSEVAGVPSHAYLVEQGSDSAYGAARVAARRGAKLLIPVLDAVTSAELAEREDLSPGALVAMGALWDLSALKPLLRLLPDSADRLPLELEPLLPQGPCWEERTLSALGGATLPEAVRSPLLAARLRKACAATLFDRQGSGYGDAAVECGLPLRPLAHVAAILDAGKIWELDAVASEAALQEQLSAVIGKAAP
ncbi:hypothetical protein GC173_13625 [bacterium]|nr:hypothetical protein [bacterium]